MAEKLFDVNILTPAKAVYSGRVASLVAPAYLGYLGILANHAPMATLITPGKIILRESSGNTVTLQNETSGFLEVLNNRVDILL